MLPKLGPLGATMARGVAAHNALWESTADPDMPLNLSLTTFERPRELRLVLEGLLAQRGAPPFEVAVCDDGSGPETAEVVAEAASRASFEIHHCWHENTGFRAAATRNLGLREACGDYVVFLDGDCIPFPSFLEQHAEAARPGSFLVGERHYLDDPVSKAIQPDQVARGEHVERVTVQEHRRVASRARKLALYRWSGLGRLKSRPKLVTANASAWLSDLQVINGFDERFEGWGHEDDDVGLRPCYGGIEKISSQHKLMGSGNRNYDSRILGSLRFVD